MQQINVSQLETAVKISPEAAKRLQAFNARRAAVESQLNNAIDAAMRSASALVAEIDLEAGEEWNKVIAELGQVQDNNWSADVKDPENAYLVRADVLQDAIERATHHIEPMVPVGDPVVDKFDGRQSER